jgi:DNA-binding NarL/FixJ family response regulator
VPPSEAPPVRVFVVEDQPGIREAMRLLLSGTPGYSCTGAAGSAEEALAFRADPPPDVVLLDVGLPGQTGVEALPAIRRRWPRAEVLMLTVHDDTERVFEALQAGASGYLVKATPPAEVLAAIRALYEGGAPMSASVARKVVEAMRRPDRPDEELSRREREVLDHLVEGKTYRQIAEALFVSPNTVAFHVKQIYGKLHVRNRTEAAARFFGRR